MCSSAVTADGHSAVALVLSPQRIHYSGAHLVVMTMCVCKSGVQRGTMHGSAVKLPQISCGVAGCACRWAATRTTLQPGVPR